MNAPQLAKDFNNSLSLGISYKELPAFALSFIVCAVLAHLLSIVYTHYGHSITNRRIFARNFMILALTTMFIISVVKSSLALSLGLLGALSIVRFRSAIKEPEELTYLFLTIAIGLGCGAGLPLFTTLAFFGFAIAIWLTNRSKRSIDVQILYLTVSAGHGTPLDLSKVDEVLRSNLDGVKFKRTNENEKGIEFLFIVEAGDFNQLDTMKLQLREVYPKLNVTFTDPSRESLNSI